MIRKLKLALLVVDAGTDTRAEIDEATVIEYGEAAKAKQELPPLVVFDTGENGLVLADGFHRYYGMERQGIKEWSCDIRKGTRKDAVKFALHSNLAHGLRRTSEDKRNCVVIASKEFIGMTDRAIAEMCAVSHTLVAEVRKTIIPPAPASPASTTTSAPPKRVGIGGNKFKAPVRSTTSAPAAPAAPVRLKSGSMDATGIPVPEEIIPAWDMAMEIGNSLFRGANELRTRIKVAQDRNEPSFRELDFTGTIAHLDNAISDLRRLKPYAVCPDCNGVMTHGKASVIKGGISSENTLAHAACPSCKGRGFVSEFYWTHAVPEEIKITTGRV